MADREDTSRSMTYMDHIRSVALAGVAIIVEKTRTYGPSWKKRGGAGAWFTTVRPWDRLETIVGRHGGDVLAAVADDPTGADGSALACIRDIRNYLTLIEAEAVAQGLVDLPSAMTEDKVQLASDTARSAGTPEEMIRETFERWFPAVRFTNVSEYTNPTDHSVTIEIRMARLQPHTGPSPARLIAESLVSQ